jgi:hypothetical protein
MTAVTGDGRLRMQCAAITNGCMAFLVIPVPHGFDPSWIDGYLPQKPRVADLLHMNGWHLDHGRWVCGAHERTAPCEHQDASGRPLPPYASLVH